MNKSVEYVAIDPLALIFPTSIYLILVEMKHPHEPNVAVIQKAAGSMTVEEKGAALARAKMMMDSAKVVVEALSTPG